MTPIQKQTGRPIRQRHRFRQRQTWYSHQSPLHALVDIMLDSIGVTCPQPPLVPMNEEPARLNGSFSNSNDEFDDVNLDAQLEAEVEPLEANSIFSDETVDFSISSMSDIERESSHSESSITTYSTEGTDEDSSLTSCTSYTSSISSISSTSSKLHELSTSSDTSEDSTLDTDEDSTISFSSGSGHLIDLIPTRAGYYLERNDGNNASSLAAGAQQPVYYSSSVGYYVEANGEAASGYDAGTKHECRCIGQPAGYYLENSPEAGTSSYDINNGQEPHHVSTPAGYYIEGGSDSPTYVGDENGEPALAPAPPGYYVERTDDVTSAFRTGDNQQQPACINSFVMSLHNLP